MVVTKAIPLPRGVVKKVFWVSSFGFLRLTFGEFFIFRLSLWRAFMEVACEIKKNPYKCYDPATLHRQLQDETREETPIYYPVNMGNTDRLILCLVLAPFGIVVYICQRNGACEEDGRYRNLIIGGNVVAVGLRISSEDIGNHPCCLRCAICCMYITCAYVSCCGFKCCRCWRTERGNDYKGEIYLEQDSVKSPKSNPYKNLLVPVSEKSVLNQNAYLGIRPLCSYLCCSRDVYGTTSYREGIEYICCCIKYRETNQSIQV